jgi:uncharacterized protein YndB with AHSA1/START domain
MTAAGLEIVTPADEPVILVRRLFRASPAVLFAAWTEPQHLHHWWGPRVLELVVCEVDLRVGGGYRFVERTADGQEHGFHGTYREIEPLQRLVSTFVYEGMPDAEAVQTVTFEGLDAGTLVRVRAVHPSFTARDAHIAGGMEWGLTNSYSRLDEWVAAADAP